MENESRIFAYMSSQPEIIEKIRAILVDWLIEVHNKFELMAKTLFLIINVVNRYRLTKTVPKEDLQLVGISTMLMASKYGRTWAPEANDFVCISDKGYTRQQVYIIHEE